MFQKLLYQTWRFRGLPTPGKGEHAIEGAARGALNEGALGPRGG